MPRKGKWRYKSTKKRWKLRILRLNQPENSQNSRIRSDRNRNKIQLKANTVIHQANHTPCVIVALLCLLCASSCRQPTEEELAEQELQTVDSLYRSRRYEEAKARIDTLHARYPKQIKTRKLAKIVELQILIEEQDSALAKAERELGRRTETFNRLSKGPYLFEKDAKYQREGIYTYRGQEAQHIKGRTLLKATVDEMGRITLQSISWGKTGHTQFTAESEGERVSSSSIPVGSGWHYTSEIEGLRYEKLIYRDEEARRLTDFLASREKGIRITLQDGERRISEYSLSRYDQEAIREMSRLATELRETREAEHTLNVAARKKSLYENELTAYRNEMTEKTDKKP